MSEFEAPAAFEPRDAKELAILFPSYEIKHLVATGGMGAVYCAVQKSLERVVAIKILPVEFSRDPEFCSAFQAEAKAMAKLNHPNLISVFDFGEVEGMLYIIMEYVEGETLHNVIQDGGIKASDSLRVMQSVCAGVASAHEHGILHRDIKPANILLDADLQPKIGDFGLARPVGREVEDGEMILGTPGYTAPEVIDPPHVFDHRADIFSLGVMLHELITGNLPGDDPRPASAQVRCHPRIDVVIRKATGIDPNQRFQCASDMADELAKITQASPIKAPTAIKLPAAAAGHNNRTVHKSPGALQPAGAFGGKPPAMVMASSGNSNIAVWVVVIILVFVGILLIVVKGGDHSKPAGTAEQQTNGLEQMLNKQIGAEHSEFEDDSMPGRTPAAEAARAEK